MIFGGAHEDLPLNENAGALIAETVAGMSESCIVSLGGLHTKAAERRFMLAFLGAIYRKADAAKADPFHVIFDEADLWAPQKSSEPMLQSRTEEIVRRGRIKGFIPWLITQRSAVLSKAVLSQVDGLIAFKLTSSQDRDAILLICAKFLASDGDSGRCITADGVSHRVRLAGVDAGEVAPFTRRRRSPTVWACSDLARATATQAQARARRLASNGARCTITDTDRYRRNVAVCTVNGRDLERILVSEGLASPRPTTPIHMAQRKTRPVAREEGFGDERRSPRPRRRPAGPVRLGRR